MAFRPRKIRSMSATEIVISPAITNPRLSTWSSVSSNVRSLCSNSSKASSIVFRSSEVVRRPRTGQLDPKARSFVLSRKLFRHFAKFIEAIFRDEKCELERQLSVLSRLVLQHPETRRGIALCCQHVFYL